MSYVHAVPGRLRVKSRVLATESRAARAACHALRAVAGVEDVAHKPRSASVIVLHDPAQVDAESLLSVARDHGLVAADDTPAMTRPSLPETPGPRAALPPGATAALASSALATVGGAVGKALFGAVIKTSLERGVTTLVTAAIR